MNELYLADANTNTCSKYSWSNKYSNKWTSIFSNITSFGIQHVFFWTEQWWYSSERWINPSDKEWSLYTSKSSKIQYHIDTFLFHFLILKHLKIEFDAQGNMNKITNLDSNLVLTFSAQGFYYYTSKSSVLLTEGYDDLEMFFFKVLLVITHVLNFELRVHMLFVHSYQLLCQLVAVVLCK